MKSASYCRSPCSAFILSLTLENLENQTIILVNPVIPTCSVPPNTCANISYNFAIQVMYSCASNQNTQYWHCFLDSEWYKLHFLLGAICDCAAAIFWSCVIAKSHSRRCNPGNMCATTISVQQVTNKLILHSFSKFDKQIPYVIV